MMFMYKHFLTLDEKQWGVKGGYVYGCNKSVEKNILCNKLDFDNFYI